MSNKHGHRGEHEVSRKTIARGMPVISGVTVVTTLVCFFFAREAAGALSTRHSLRPLLSRARMVLAKLGRIAPRDRRCISGSGREMGSFWVYRVVSKKAVLRRDLRRVRFGAVLSRARGIGFDDDEMF